MSATDRDYPHLGQPEGLTFRGKASWRRQNTWYVKRGEAIAPEVYADPPDCFTQDEWEKYLDSLSRDGFRLEESPNLIPIETPDEAVARQKRATRAAACDDCLLFFQISNVVTGRCQPPQYAITPADRLLATDRHGGIGDDAAPGDGTRSPDVLQETRLRDGEDR